MQRWRITFTSNDEAQDLTMFVDSNRKPKDDFCKQIAQENGFDRWSVQVCGEVVYKEQEKKTTKDAETKRAFMPKRSDGRYFALGWLMNMFDEMKGDRN